MGRKKDSSCGDEETEGRKRHKKNKRKRHKAREGDRAPARIMEVEAEPGGRPLTLKIKLGGKPVSSATVNSDGEEGCSVTESEVAAAEDSLGGKDGLWPPSDTSVLEDAGMAELEEAEEEEGEEEEEGQGGSEGDEEAWLVAMEKGQLDETGYLPRRSGPNLTARQRAMLGATESELMELPLGKAAKEMTEEMMLKKTEKNRKRRLAAQRRKERRKAETVRKLLEKQRKKKEEEKPTTLAKPHLSSIHYVSALEGSSISMPPGQDFPLPAQKIKVPRAAQLCAVKGCSNLRRYSDTTTHLPLCSLQCYKALRLQTSS